MNTYDLQTQPVNTPNPTEVLLAQESSRRLTTLLGNGSNYQLQFLSNSESSEILALPATAVRLLAEILAEMAQGNAVNLVSVHEELTVSQAAQMLTVSQAYLEQLLDNGQLPCHGIGTHRRIRFEDAMTYKKNRYAARTKTLDALAAYDQELGLE